MTEPLNFQSIIMALQQFWAEQGCLIWQPYYSQVGAGTMNPATFLRVLGPEPWRVAYVEPSVRPDDGRYGDNPNRLQMHYQMQVILKPDPGNPQEIYLRSLQAIGIDPTKHDIRFVEDNWQQPALGAWGLGWEVWLDGLEITQFTYFQQAGGLPLDPVSVEITYGLDRIAAPLQGVRGFQDIRWDEKHSFGEVNLQGEFEHSKYYFEIADVERLRQMYDLFEAETEEALGQNLVLPAYDYLLKCSHAFNVLDTRGAIGVTERQAYFRRMRRLAAQVAEMYVEGRQREEYPWLEEGAGEQGGTGAGEKKSKTTELKSAAPFLLEIGTEELPPGDLEAALDQLGKQTPQLLDDLHLAHDEIRILGTPRRLVVHVEGLAPRQPDREELVKGPPADRAFDADGTPTKAGEGFARGKGVAVKDLEILEMDGGSYVVAHVKEQGRSSVEVLAESLPDLIAGLNFERSMRWNSSNVAFSRPIRWLLALHGEQVIPFEYAGLQSSNQTRGLRFSEPEVVPVKDAADYFGKLESQGIILDSSARKAAILEQVTALAKEVGGTIPEDPDLLDEVTNLVDAPAAVRGTFDKEHLELPREVLVQVMKKHQRYFPVEKDGELLPYFITVANGMKDDMSLIAEGNQDVVRARFVDAAYFIKEDLKKPLEYYRSQIEYQTFQSELGTYGEKVRRVRDLLQHIMLDLPLTRYEQAISEQAAVLCKADLATQMVIEMTSLQGIMGKYYALQSGIDEAVAIAIYEHYLPRFQNDKLPVTKPGATLGVADRLDTLAGLFSVGLIPSGNKDPFALRRAAIGLIQILIAWDWDVDLASWVTKGRWFVSDTKDVPERLRECLEFITRRMQALFVEDGFRYDVVDSILAAQGQNPAGAKRGVEALSRWVTREDWQNILDSYARCVRITRDLEETDKVDPKLFVEGAEKDLYKALEKAEESERAPGSVDDFLNAFAPMIPAITRFFDEVLVMDENIDLQRNRLGLLQRIAALADGVADMSKLEGF